MRGFRLLLVCRGDGTILLAMRPWQAPLDQPPWQEAEAIRRKLVGAGHQAVFVGGCVRDGLLGLPVKDADLATDADPDRVEELFPHSVAVGKAFGVIVVVCPSGAQVEVASFRSDEAYIDGRRPSGVQPSDERGDVARRDFTINALAYDPDAGGIRDHVGGLADIDRRILRVVGEPAARLAEDRLRSLRGLRFAAQLELDMDPDTARALRGTSLAGLSRERIWGEWDKAAGHPRRAAWWRSLVDYALAREVLPWLPDDAEALRALAGPLQRLPPDADPDTALALILSLAAPLADLSSEPLSRPRSRRIAGLTSRAAPETWEGAGIADRRRLLRDADGAALIALWQARAPGLAAEDLMGRRRAELGVPWRPLLSATDLLARGWPPGPALGRALRRLEDAQLAGEIVDRTAAEDLADRLRGEGTIED